METIDREIRRRVAEYDERQRDEFFTGGRIEYEARLQKAYFTIGNINPPIQNSDH